MVSYRVSRKACASAIRILKNRLSSLCPAAKGLPFSMPIVLSGSIIALSRSSNGSRLHKRVERLEEAQVVRNRRIEHRCRWRQRIWLRAG